MSKDTLPTQSTTLEALLRGEGLDKRNNSKNDEESLLEIQVGSVRKVGNTPSVCKYLIQYYYKKNTSSMFDTTVKMYIEGIQFYIFDKDKYNMACLLYVKHKTILVNGAISKKWHTVKFIIQNRGAENHQSNKLTASNCSYS